MGFKNNRIKIVSLFYLILIFIGCDNYNQINSEKNNNSIDILELKSGFKSPSKQYYPETWFHLNGNNISKEGLKLDLKAVKEAGLQGVHLFNKAGRSFPNVKPVKILSKEWEEMIRFAAEECKRLGLKFTMQNCPGWSMTGGPWVPVEEAQREIVESTYSVSGGITYDKPLAINPLFLEKDCDYKDIQVLAFPTPEGDDIPYLKPSQIESNNDAVPWKDIFNPNSIIQVTRKTTHLDRPLEKYRKEGITSVGGKMCWVKLKFANEVTLRSIVFPQMRHILLDTEYPKVDVSIRINANINDKSKRIITLKLPDANWNDRRKHLTLAVPETTSKEFVFIFRGSHKVAPEFIRLSSKPRLHNYETKAAKVLRGLQKEVGFKSSEKTFIQHKDVIDITDKMSSDGRLKWKVPQGKWTIVRFGHVNMRLKNKPAVPEATGWEASKLDKQAIENHLRKGMIGDLIQPGGPIGDGKLQGLLIDSWESHVPTWTMNSEIMFEEFEKRRGYSMKKYLPATMGYIVENPKVSSMFLRDLRHTMDDVFVDNFFKHFATVAHEMGAQVYTEGAGGEVLPIDPMRYYGVSDIPMTEFWYPKAPSAQNEYAKPIYSAASATHLYNKPMLAAEACTQVGVKWNEHPFSVKSLIDYNFAKGVNHLVFHTFSHTPQTDVSPGSSFGGNIGFPLVREQTWWKYMSDWTEYLARNQFVLQQGEYVADVLWYYGDNYERPPFDLDEFPKGYRFDYLNSEVLQEKLAMKNGNIHVKDGGDYKVIMLRDSEKLLLSNLKKIKELVLEGAVVLGKKTITSPSLMDNASDLKELKVISDELWATTERGSKKVGKGRVYWGMSLEEVLDDVHIAKDVIVPDNLELNWIHRETKDTDIYFIASSLEAPVNVSLSFRVENRNPQIWDAFTGEVKEAKVWKRLENRTNVALRLAARGSAVVVFSKGDSQPIASKIGIGNQLVLSAENNWFTTTTLQDFPHITWRNEEMSVSKSGTYKFFKESEIREIEKKVVLKSLQDKWTLRFEKGWDTPNIIKNITLKSLSTFKNGPIQHYSGTTTYQREFNWNKENNIAFLDLGQVANIAEVWCNGKKVGVKWAPPFRYDLTDFIVEGSNRLEVKVTNTWRNQLFFDRTRKKGEKKTWTTSPPNKNDSNLEPSGLIGPVLLEMSH